MIDARRLRPLVAILFVLAAGSARAADLAAGEAFLAGFAFGPPPADDRWALGEGGEALPKREQT